MVKLRKYETNELIEVTPDQQALLDEYAEQYQLHKQYQERYYEANRALDFVRGKLAKHFPELWRYELCIDFDEATD